MYADLDVWLALLRDDDWLGDPAERLLADHEDDLEVSLVTFVELFLVEERYPFDRGRAVTAILELAAYDGDPDVIYRASAYIDEGLTTFDAFHAALSGGRILSSERVRRPRRGQARPARTGRGVGVTTASRVALHPVT